MNRTACGPAVRELTLWVKTSIFPLTAVGPAVKLKPLKRFFFWRKKAMRKVLTVVLLGIGAGIAAYAQAAPSPEIDPASVGSALALLAGTLLVVRGRRGK